MASARPGRHSLFRNQRLCSDSAGHAAWSHNLAEMIAFARLGSVACERVVPDVDGFHALALQRLIKPPLTEKEIGAKEKDVKRLRDPVGLNGWCRRYAGKMEQARILVQVLRRKN
jgi:hypothetical protein